MSGCHSIIQSKLDHSKCVLNPISGAAIFVLLLRPVPVRHSEEALGGLHLAAEGRGEVHLRRRRLRIQDQVPLEPRAPLPETLALLGVPRKDSQGSIRVLMISSAWYSNED